EIRVNLCEVQRDQGCLVGEAQLHEAALSAQQGHLSVVEVADFNEELALLPGSPQQDQWVLALAVHLSRVEVQGEGFVRPVEPDEAVCQVVVSGQEEARVLAAVGRCAITPARRWSSASSP